MIPATTVIRRMPCPRVRRSVGLTLLTAWVGMWAAGERAGNAGRVAEEFFETHVRPVLVEHCFQCHGATKQESGLRLDSRAAILRGGDGERPVVVPGRPEASRLIEAIGYRGAIQMPPDRRLSDRQIAALTQWVRAGLPWPKGRDAPAAAATAAVERRDTAGRSHWSLQPIHRHLPPTGRREPSRETEIDAWAAAGLRRAGMGPSPRADRPTLIRRLTYDLIGLPPTPEQVDAFLRDTAPDAYQRLVDRLLASPHYGERWGRHWLDVARYADTRGYAFGRERRFPYAYTYRDYVIRAWNEDLPYDRLVLEQLAADQLPDLRGRWHLAAMGFLTVGRRYNNLHDDIDDQIDVVTRGLLGLTVACARCHDHKYDPIETEDYYALYGVFASCREPEEGPLIVDVGSDPKYAAFREELARRQAAIERYRAERLHALIDTSRRHVTDYLIRVASKQPEALLRKQAMLSLTREELKPRLVERWRRFLAKRSKEEDRVFGPWHALLAVDDTRFAEDAGRVLDAWRTADPQRINGLVGQRLLAAPPATKIALAQRYGRLFEEVYAAWRSAGGDDRALASLDADQQELAHLLLDEGTPTALSAGMLGGYLSRQEAAKLKALQKKIDTWKVESPAAPPRAMVLVDRERPRDAAVLIRGNPGRRGPRVPRRFLRLLSGPGAPPFRHGSGRLELARAITDPDNPLTARVLVNRVWMHHLAAPLVDSPSDFGVRCRAPVQGEILDALARYLIDHRWSVKRLHRWIVCSHVYRQTSGDRPRCRRIDPENRLLWRMNRRRLEFEPMRDTLLALAGRLDPTIGGRPMDWRRGVVGRRRAVYGLIDRQDLPGLLRTFDFASPDQSTARRPATTVPAQALFLMNNPFVIECAKAVAARVSASGALEPPERIERLYRMVFCRAPTPFERQVGQQFLAAARQLHADPWPPYAQLLLMTNELHFVE